MTAEIAILNKTAVALAADSAVTISAGSSQEKIYDSADKLFELSDEIPIGIMINSDMNFMETPIPVLIKDYRRLRRCFERVEEAATDFLSYLHEFGRASPDTINLHKRGLSVATTGVVFAGFGKSELFPTLFAFQMEGMLSDRLKFHRTYAVDIDRRGVGARVIPFAQREMVERFLYGLDGSIERQVTQFCQSSVPKIREEILESLEMSDEDRNALEERARAAERGFFDGLAQESFAAIRRQSRGEIEDMVEFMPKPELAKMAEALVNLTSIKRRVSRGMETVGGPIDVAVISKSEGFIWVKRKHYFPEELNYRFFDRMRAQIGQNGSKQHGEDLQSGTADA